MTDLIKNSYKTDASAEVTLGLLKELETSDQISQRNLASRLGVALGRRFLRCGGPGHIDPRL